jgi:DNA-binding MarR family transcriptional regulator
VEEQAQQLDLDLRAVRQILRRPVEATIALGGLTGPQQSAMELIVRSGDGLTLKELARELGLSHSTASGIVDRLAAKGLLERRVDESDRRFSRIVASDIVHKFMRDHWPMLNRNPLQQALAAATPSERKRVLEGMRTLRRLLEQRNVKTGGQT